MSHHGTSAAVIESPYLTAPEAVQYLKVYDLSALYKLMKNYRLPYLRCGGRLRFDKRDLDTWMKESVVKVDLARVKLTAVKAR